MQQTTTPPKPCASIVAFQQWSRLLGCCFGYRGHRKARNWLRPIECFLMQFFASLSVMLMQIVVRAATALWTGDEQRFDSENSSSCAWSNTELIVQGERALDARGGTKVDCGLPFFRRLASSGLYVPWIFCKSARSCTYSMMQPCAMLASCSQQL